MRCVLDTVLALAAILALTLVGSANAENLFERAAKGISDAASSLGDTITEKTTPATGADLDRSVDQALQRLFASSPDAKELANKSAAVLVFPSVAKGGFLVGGQYGEGALLQGGVTKGYYNIAGLSYGLQIGGQSFSYAMFFLSESALEYFYNNNGWEFGTGPTLVGGDKGWSSSLGTNDLQGDIAPVFFGQKGLMAGSSLQGIKITRLER